MNISHHVVDYAYLIPDGVFFINFYLTEILFRYLERMGVRLSLTGWIF